MISPHLPVERGRRFRWTLARRAPAEILAEVGDCEPLLCQLLLNRGLDDPDDAWRFLAAEREPLGDPLSLAEMPAALSRLEAALDGGEMIAIYGDYDVDGITATALLCSALGRLGARVQPFIPNRETDGYGLRDRALAGLRAAGASLVVTVDCGVSAV